MRYELHSTKEFTKWLDKRKDKVTKRKILARLGRVENGNFGDHKQLSSELHELRFFFGSGLRIYYIIRDGRVVLLLAGGDKSSQKKDIEIAKKLILELEE